MTVKGQNNWKFHTFCDKGRTKILAIYLKDTSAAIHPLSLPAWMYMIIGQYVLPSCRKCKYYSNVVCRVSFLNREYISCPLVARILPVDEHIRKHISSLLKILEGSVSVSSNFFSCTYTCTSQNQYVIPASETKELA